MKKIQLLFLIVSFFGLGSCKDMLEVIPENSVTFENAIRSEKDVESMVTSIRSMFRNSVSNWSNFEIFWRGVIADEYLDENIIDAKELRISAHSPRSMSLNWAKFYNVIATTHVVLDHADNAEGVPADRMKFYKGQAYFYRAYVYFMLVQCYGEVPVIINGRDVEEKAKSSWEQVIQQVFDDVQKAIGMLPTRDKLYDYAGNQINRNDVPCYEAACMLKAMACAWKASLNRDIYGKDEPELYTEAVRLATEVIASPNFELAGSSEKVCTEVLAGGSREGIFEVHNDLLESGINSFTTARLFVTWPVRRDHDITTITSDKRENMRAKIKYATADKLFGKDDLRRDAYFFELDSMGRLPVEITGGYSYPYKFRKEGVWDAGYEKGTFKNFDQAHVIYRLADIILLRAECYARLNQTAPAIADLKHVRDRAYGMLTVYPLEGVDDPARDLRYHIYKERERELLWEDQRYFDMVRNGYYRTEMGTEQFRALTDQEVKDGALYLPVTNSAFTENRLMTQNRYWTRRFN